MQNLMPAWSDMYDHTCVLMGYTYIILSPYIRVRNIPYTHETIIIATHMGQNIISRHRNVKFDHMASSVLMHTGRWVLVRLAELNDLSLTEFVAGITKINRMSLHTVPLTRVPMETSPSLEPRGLECSFEEPNSLCGNLKLEGWCG